VLKQKHMVVKLGKKTPSAIYNTSCAQYIMQSDGHLTDGTTAQD